MAGRIEPEIIPDADTLFCRVHRAHYDFKENRISRAVFGKPNQSVDWEKFSTPEQTVARYKKRQSDIVGIAKITAGQCRELSQQVVHVPLGSEDQDGPNDAHSEIRGDKPGMILSKMRDLSEANDFWQNPEFK